MSTAITMAPSPAPHDRPTSYGADLPVNSATAKSSPSSQRIAPAPPSAAGSGPPNAPAAHQQRTGSGSPKGPHPPTTSKPSPPSARVQLAGAPRIKKEPASPEPPPPPPTARHRPRRLDLSQNTISTSGNTPGTGRPLTAREGLGIQEVGFACLSPGFITQDPMKKQQLERSRQVQEQQRHLIEQRNKQQQSAKGDGPDGSREGGHGGPSGGFAARTPGMSRRNKAPPGLSIVAPSAEQFANERVIQSAPLNHSFDMMHNQAHPLSRHLQQHSKLANTTHMHITHQPVNQTNNRLPPIADVFGARVSGHPDNSGHSMFSNQQHRGPLTSPGHPPPPPPPPPQQQQQQQHHQQQQHQQQQMSSGAPLGGNRPKEYRSAEEAQAELAGGRPDLLPRLVHYTSPPSPGAGAGGAPVRPHPETNRTASSTKRLRMEYEEGGSPPLGSGPAFRRSRYGDSPESQQAKRDEFLQLCARAWDLLHS